MFKCLKLKYNGQTFEDENGNEYFFYFRGYINNIERDCWYYCQIKGDTLYDLVKAQYD